MKISEHSRDGSDWVDDIKGHQHDSSEAVDDIQSHPRGRVGRAWRTRQDVRKYAAEHQLAEDEALHAGMKQKAREFTEAGAEIYSKA